MVDNVAHAIAKTALDFSWPTSRSRISQRCLPSPALVIGSFLASILLRPIRKTPSHSRHTLLTTSTTFPSSMCPGDHAVVTDDFPTQNAKETYSYIVQYSFSFFFFLPFSFLLTSTLKHFFPPHNLYLRTSTRDLFGRHSTMNVTNGRSKIARPEYSVVVYYCCFLLFSFFGL